MKKRALGIDYGLKRIGLALSDEMKMIASPWKMVLADKNIEKTAQMILEEVKHIEKEKECHVDEIVMGYPLHMDGRVGVLAEEVEQLHKVLSTLTDIKLTRWDERLTSVQAERSLRESNMSRKKRTKSVDTVAATIILQNYLDSCSI